MSVYVFLYVHMYNVHVNTTSVRTSFEILFSQDSKEICKKIIKKSWRFSRVYTISTILESFKNNGYIWIYQSINILPYFANEMCLLF